MTQRHRLVPFAAGAAGIALFSVMDATMKGASLAVGVYTALLLRCVIGTVLTLPLWMLTGGRWPERPVLKVHLIRSAVAAVMATLFFWGLVRIPIAEAIALSFISPLIALYLASALLGETIGRRAIGASVLGLAGVVVIAFAQGSAAAQRDPLGIGAVLVSAVFYAWNLILQRQQAQAAGPAEVAFFQNAAVGLILVAAAPWLFARPDLPTLGWIAAAAVLATVSLMLLSWAYGRAEAQALLPLEYTAFIWAALFGWLWFDERVTFATLGGAALIVAACLIGARQPSLPPDPLT